MSYSLAEDIKTVAEFERRPREILNQVHETRRPVVVTVNGKPDVVVVDAVAFERRLKLANLSQLLLEAEADVRAGRTRPARTFMKDFRRAKEVSG